MWTFFIILPNHENVVPNWILSSICFEFSICLTLVSYLQFYVLIEMRKKYLFSPDEDEDDNDDDANKNIEILT